jgi:hypothetical protein
MLGNRTLTCIASAAALAAGSFAYVATSGTADASTGQCVNTGLAVNPPIGCGAVILPWVGYPHAGFALTLTAPRDAFGAPLKVEPLAQSPLQDWTAYLVCTGQINADRTAADPCGSTGTLLKDRVVFQLTPDGMQPEGGVNSQNGSFCADDNNAHVALGMCQGNRTFFVAGIPDGPWTDGIPPVVSNPIAAEEWQLVKDGSGAELRDVYSGRNLDDPGLGGPGTYLTTWPDNSSADQKWQVAGCSNPFPTLTGDYGCWDS